MPQNWLSYPIGHGYITTYSGGDTPHFADDVETPFHTPITALWSGTVKQADYATWDGQPGGGEIFIQPDQGGDEYYYYHLDDLNVSAGQHVAAGQLVGLSGGQNSGGDHPTSPMWSSGPHIHVGYFEKYVSTPAGSRPYGPDITSALESGSFSSLGVNSVQPLSSLLNVGPNVQLPSEQQVVDVGYRILFVILGIMLLYLGIKHFIDLPTLNFSSEPAEQSNDQGGAGESQGKDQGKEEKSEEKGSTHAPEAGEASEAGGSSELAEAAEVAAL